MSYASLSAACSGTDAVPELGIPAIPPTHDCRKSWNLPGILGGWTCICKCHHITDIENDTILTDTWEASQ